MTIMALTDAIKSETRLNGADIAVVIIYFVCVIGVGIFVS